MPGSGSGSGTRWATWALRSINTKAGTECLVSVHLESMSLPELRLRCQGASYQSQTKSACPVSWSLGWSQLSRLPTLGSKCARGAVCRLDVGLGGLVTFMTASLGALCPPWQGGDVSRMPGGRGTPATDSSSTTESHYWGLTSQLSKQSIKQTTNYPTGRQTQNARFWDLEWLVNFLTFFEPQPNFQRITVLKDEQAHPYQLFLSCLTTFVNTINHSYIVKWKFFVLRITFYFQIFSWLVSLNLKK